MLDSLDPGDDVPVEWIIDWGDGSTATRVAGDVSSASHDYAVGGNYVIRATLVNDDGSFEAVPLAVSVADRPLLQVTEAMIADGELTVRFSVPRSEERRGGQGGVSTCRSRW